MKKRDYLSGRELKKSVRDIEFDQSGGEEVNSFANQLLAIERNSKSSFGDRLHSVKLEEIREGYEDWYFAVIVRYWESEKQFNKRIDAEEAEHAKGLKILEQQRAKEAHNKDIDKQIAELKKLKK